MYYKVNLGLVLLVQGVKLVQILQQNAKLAKLISS